MGGNGPPFTISPTDTVSFLVMNTDFLALDKPSGSRNEDRFSSTQLSDHKEPMERHHTGKRPPSPLQTPAVAMLPDSHMETWEAAKVQPTEPTTASISM